MPLFRYSCPTPRHSGYGLSGNVKLYSKKSAGFTLIEVLIAAVILFSALAVTAELYSASSLSAQKASNKAHFYQINPIAITAIKTEIRGLSENRKLAEFSSELNISGIHYQWQAQRVAFEPRAPEFDDNMPPKAQFGLFQVNVRATNIQADKTETFQFKVATW
ncbi:MAG: prepilin-type N-terminal cleavage/methylation domain-containing protein [Colwellia sp.]|nr:prepilin-type N-terminal cleavage/methylation domain-containing protein [Colwellia sp.]